MSGPSPSARQRTIIATAVTGVVLTASACGGSASKKEVVRLRSANPLTSNVYVRVEGPAGAVSYITRRLAAGAFRKDEIGIFLPPSPHHPKPLCSFTHTIGRKDPPELRRWRGKKMRLAVYGPGGILCKTLRSGIFR